MAVASNGCAEVSATITIALTDCPTCHSTKSVNGGALANGSAAVVTASVIDASGKTVSGDCPVPRAAETPVVTLNADLSATISWDSAPAKNAAAGYTYEVSWDAGEYWVEAPRQDIVRVNQSPYVWGDLNPLVTYRFAVRVVNDCGAGPFSESNYVVVP